MNTSIPIAAVGFAALAVAGSALVGATTATAADDARPTLPHLAEKRAQVTACTGGQALSMVSRAVESQIVSTSTPVDVEGSQLVVRGPKRGTDRILVTLSALATNGPTDVGTATLYKDGVGTPEGPKYFGYGSSTGYVQFCGTVTKGQHTFVLKIKDDGGPSLVMYNPTITYERFD